MNDNKPKLTNVIFYIFSGLIFILLIANILYINYTGNDFIGFGNFLEVVSNCPDLFSLFGNFSSSLDSFSLSLPHWFAFIKPLLDFVKVLAFVGTSIVQILIFVLYFVKFILGV